LRDNPQLEREGLAEWVEQILHLEYADFEVVVVDNGSVDGGERVLEERYPSVLVFRSGRNLGYGAGMNLGLAWGFGAAAARETQSSSSGPIACYSS